MIETFIQEGVIGEKLITGLTPNYILAQLQQQPLLNSYLNKNTEEIQQRFIDVLSRVPCSADRPGFIYGFRNKKTYNSQDMHYQIKLGRTSKQIPQYRIFEWEKTDNHEYVQIFTVRSQFNFKLQLLVHLLFAYARKTLIINGKKRIEWFQFAQKVATAAITNLLNMLMEKIHEKYIDKLQGLQSISSLVDYDYLIQNVMAQCIIHKQQSGLVAFGLPKTGKTVFRSILLEEQISVESQRNRLQLVTKNRQNRDSSLFIQISTIQQSPDNIKQLEYYFAKCLEICLPQLFAILVVKQSDIESSGLIGVTRALDALEKYVKLGDSLLIVVTKATKEFNKADILETIQENQKLITNRHFELLKNSQYIVVKAPQSEGPFLSSAQNLEIRSKVFGYFDTQKQKFLQLQPKLQKDILALCYEVVQKSYEDLQELYAKSFNQKYLQFIEEQYQIQFINITRKMIDQLKMIQKQSQSQMFKSIIKIASHLDLSEKAKVQSYLYVFCQMSLNKTMLRSNIFVSLIESMNEKIANVTQTYNQNLAQNLSDFRQAIADYLHAGNTESLPLLKQIMQAANLDQINKIIKKMQYEEKHSDKQQVKGLLRSLTSLTQTIEQIGKYTVQGLKFNSVEGRIREAIYNGLRSQRPKGVKEELQMKSHIQIQESQELSAITISTVHQNNGQKQKHTFNFMKMSQLLYKTKQLKDGVNVFNFCQEFSFDQSSKINLKHSLFIFARRIKVYNNTQFSFGTVVPQGSQKIKLKLMIVSSHYQNAKKLMIPKGSANGDGYALYVEQDSITCVYPQDKKADQSDQKTFLYLRQLHKQKFS